MQRTQEQIDKIESEYNRRNTQLIAILSENAGLKAAVGLLREHSGADARRTISDQLQVLSEGLDYDLLMLVDTEGKVAATTGAAIDDSEVDASSFISGGSSLVRLGKVVYELTTVPINLGSENIGTLAVGKTFDLNSFGRPGYTFLLEGNQIAASTLSDAWTVPIERQLSETCGRQNNGCEIRLGSETYLVLEMDRSAVDSGSGLHHPSGITSWGLRV